jgi:hypothetical protein
LRTGTPRLVDLAATNIGKDAANNAPYHAVLQPEKITVIVIVAVVPNVMSGRGCGYANDESQTVACAGQPADQEIARSKFPRGALWIAHGDTRLPGQNYGK